MNNLPDDQPLATSHQPLVKTGGGHPEREPVSETPLEEVEEAPQLPREVQKAGVAPIQGQIKLSVQDKKAGMTEAGEATPVSLQPTQAISLPLTDDQIQEALHQKIANSILWLATWCLRQLRMAHHKIIRASSFK